MSSTCNYANAPATDAAPYHYQPEDATMDVGLKHDEEIISRIANLRLDAHRAYRHEDEERASIPTPPTPRIPQGSFSSFEFSASASTDSFADILTPSTPPRYRSRPAIADYSSSTAHPHFLSYHPQPSSYGCSTHPRSGLGFSGLLKEDGSGLPLTGLGILPHRPDSPHDAYGPSYALLNEVYMTFSATPDTHDQDLDALECRPPSPFLLSSSQLPPLSQVSPGRVTPAVFEDVFYVRGREEGKGPVMFSNGKA